MIEPATRDRIAYEIYRHGRASKATMSFEDFSKDTQSRFIVALKELADAIILSVPELQSGGTCLDRR